MDPPEGPSGAKRALSSLLPLQSVLNLMCPRFSCFVERRIESESCSLCGLLNFRWRPKTHYDLVTVDDIELSTSPFFIGGYDCKRQLYLTNASK